MIRQSSFPPEPWAVRETRLELAHLAQTESVFALGNGHIGLRGNLDEGEPFGIPGTYLAGFCETRPLESAEPAYGQPLVSETVLNVTNGKLMRLLVDDEPLDIRYGELRGHERLLDLRAGTLNRGVEWVSPTGRAVRVHTTRLVSFSQRAVAAILYEVEPLEDRLAVVVQSELVANEPLPAPGGDPRAGVALRSTLRSERVDGEAERAILAHSTATSGLTVAAAMDHAIEAPPGCETTLETHVDIARLAVACELEPGQKLRIVKLLGYGWSAERTVAALRDQVAAALAGARRTGWEGLLDEQRAYLDRFWERADVEIEGDAALQQAVRFGLFHVLQAGARGEQRAIAAKGLTGPGYDGHTFWDTETFVLPVLTYTAPQAAGDALRWRHRTLGLARERARELGLAGAAFPWRTIGGRECSGYWPAGTAAFHVNADIADAVARYTAASGDEAFAREAGVDLLVETARLWRSLGHHDERGRFRIDGVTGPDEYSALADNNVYTNLMAQRNLRAAADAVERDPERAAALDVDHEEAAGWRDAAREMLIPHDAALGVHPQAEAFTEHAAWDFDATRADQYPLMLHFPYFELYRKQVLKQADLVLAMHLRGDAFSAEQKARNFDYYEPLTARDSSLSACTQAVLAAEVGHLELAYDYLLEAALMDLDDIEHNTRDGVHIASLAGTWIAAVAGLGGMRDHDGALSFSPRLPAALMRLAFRLCFAGRMLHVEVRHHEARYTLLEGEALEIKHHGKHALIEAERPLIHSIPHSPRREAPKQPPGRAPGRERSATPPGPRGPSIKTFVR
ncbi:MAG TPA: glycosyl hydrolase family 65 protein [Solirubrobacteraceae bacterium]|jgi:alpha,alpha-trehalose phosphorylase|nr:glycosyl hydrolase family 65 protein [Solirubrobacteraceae bacterium]